MINRALRATPTWFCVRWRFRSVNLSGFEDLCSCHLYLSANGAL